MLPPKVKGNGHSPTPVLAMLDSFRMNCYCNLVSWFPFADSFLRDVSSCWADFNSFLVIKQSSVSYSSMLSAVLMELMGLVFLKASDCSAFKDRETQVQPEAKSLVCLLFICLFSVFFCVHREGIYSHGGQLLILSVLHYCFLPFPLGQCFSLNPMLTDGMTS